MSCNDVPELLPCPDCGSPAEMKSSDDEGKEWFVQCTDIYGNGCQVWTGYTVRETAEALVDWNYKAAYDAKALYNRKRNTANTEAVPRRGSDVGTSPLLAVSEVPK